MFKKYKHIERLGSDEVRGILNGTCYIFPKIDGTNASVWVDTDDGLCAGSRNRQLTLEQDNAGFYQWVLDHCKDFASIFTEYHYLRFFGEWLVPHTLRTYREGAWRRFYIFDVYDDEEERYLSYKEYEPLISFSSFPVVAPIEIVENPTTEHLIGLLDHNTYLVADGSGFGEGIVIKRYDFVNKWGRQEWAKLVRKEFTERNSNSKTTSMLGSLEAKLATEYVTRGRIKKTMEKMRDDGPVSRSRIPELFGRIWHEIIGDEMWSIVKKHKRPTIDFSEFYSVIISEIKHNTPELFG